MNWAKFYLAFENSLCDDYITEKFHNILENFNTVPVVMGPRKEDYIKVCFATVVMESWWWWWWLWWLWWWW